MKVGLLSEGLVMHVAAKNLLEALPTRKRYVINHLLSTLELDELRALVSNFNGHSQKGVDDTARISLLCAYSSHLSGSFPTFSFVQSHLANGRPDIVELKPRHTLTRSLLDMTGHPVDCLDTAVFQSLLEILPNGWLVAIPVQQGYKANVFSFPTYLPVAGKEDIHAVSK